MTLTAKTIIADKFWIVEDEGNKVATIRVNADNGNVFLVGKEFGSQMFSDITDLRKSFNIRFDSPAATTAITDSNGKYMVYGFEADSKPYNELFDVTKKVPVYTKQEKSKSYFCAGHYVLEIENTWIPVFCPKLITLNRNNFRGPYKTEEEVKEVIRSLQHASYNKQKGINQPVS